MITLESQPLEMCASLGLTEEEVEYMVIHSAKVTHIWANRRYHDWFFDVELDPAIRVFTMRRINS